jgi:hypothetical protein
MKKNIKNIINKEVKHLIKEQFTRYEFEYCPIPGDGIMTPSNNWDGTTCTVNSNPTFGPNPNGTYNTNGYMRLVAIGSDCTVAGNQAGLCNTATPAVGKTVCLSMFPNMHGVNDGGPCAQGSLGIITGNVQLSNASNGSLRFASDVVPQGMTPPPPPPPQPTGSMDCTQADFDYGSTCGQQHLAPAPGNANSFTTWLGNQFNAFNGNAGCYQFGAIQTFIGQQLTPTSNCPALPQMVQFGQYGGEKPNGQCHSLMAVKYLTL